MPRICVQCFSENHKTPATVVYREEPYCDGHVKSLRLPESACSPLGASLAPARAVLPPRVGAGSIPSRPTVSVLDRAVPADAAGAKSIARPQGKRPRSNAIDREKVIAAAKEGKAVAAIAADLNCSGGSIYCVLREAGIKAPRFREVRSASISISSAGSGSKTKVSPVGATVASTKPAAVIASPSPVVKVTLGVVQGVPMAVDEFRRIQSAKRHTTALDPLIDYLIEKKPAAFVMDVPKGKELKQFVDSLYRRLRLEKDRLDYGIAQDSHRQTVALVLGGVKLSQRKAVRTSAQKGGGA